MAVITNKPLWRIFCHLDLYSLVMYFSFFIFSFWIFVSFFSSFFMYNFFFFDWKRHKDLLIDKNKYKRRMRNPPAKES